MYRLFGCVLVALLAFSAMPAMAVEADLDRLRKQIDELNEEIDYLHSRIDKNERHSVLDRINWYGDLRVKGDHLRYTDITLNQGFMVGFDQFGMDAMTGAFGDMTDPTSPINTMMAQYPELAQAFAAGLLPSQGMFGPGVQKFDDENDILYTTRLRLGMKAEVYDNVNFSGRLSMYKNWGDSTGVQVFDSFGSFTMDGTNSGNTTGDFLHVERAYFDWKDIGGSNFYLSIGRRPSTYGPPTHLRENEMRGGTPSGHLVNFNFDGITVGYKLGKHTGIEGQTVRFCYGQGFESQHGNGSLFAETELEDTHLGGFNIDAINDGVHFLQLTLFGALDVTDSFKGLAVLPFQDRNGDGIMEAYPNSMGYITRLQGSENIGNMLLGGIGYMHTTENDSTWFVSGGWTRTLGNDNYNPSGLGGLLADATPVFEVTDIDENGNPVLESNGEFVTDGLDEDHDGYSIYVGFQTPAPMGKFGVEYNWGSKYWTPFTQAQDDMVGSKLATRGHVGEAYYIFDVNPNMFIKVGALYYDYEYTGSGSPVGKPKKVEDVQDGKEFSMFPVIDTAWDINASLTVNF